MSIKQKLFLFITTLGILIITFTGNNLYQAWNDKSQLQRAYDSAEITNLLLLAANEWSLERRLTETALSSPMKVSDSVYKNIKKHRGVAR